MDAPIGIQDSRQSAPEKTLGAEDTQGGVKGWLPRIRLFNNLQEGWSDALRLETQPFGIDVVIVEPGAIKTEWGEIAVENLRKTSGSGPYAKAANRTADTMAKMYGGDQPSDPSVIGKVILKAATARRPKTRYAVGHMARSVLFLRWILSDRMFDRMINSIV